MTWQPTLSQRLSAVFAALLLACCGASVLLQIRASVRQDQELAQRLSMGLAAHIAANAELVQPEGLDPHAVRSLFGKLMDVNPSVEVYLLGTDGRIVAQDAPAGHMKRDRVDLRPVQRLLAGEALPVLGDDPRSAGGRKVFSAAPLRRDGRDAGYVYVVLQGEDHDALFDRIDVDHVLRTTLWAMAVVACLGLVAGLAAFRWVTAPLRALTRDVQRVQADGGLAAVTPDDRSGDEIATLRRAHAAMQQRIAEQWRELAAQDRQRREMVANLSHDLRTPLTSLHGYLETMRLKADTLPAADRARYLDIAIDQSSKVGRLAQALFELARLEDAAVKPDKEPFSLPELVQDVLQKFELSAEARRQRLGADIAPDLPTVVADVGMIERVLTNLIDNAVRHTPQGGRVDVQLRRDDAGIAVRISDDGPGVPAALRPHLFVRQSQRAGSGDSGGLGLVIVRRILQLHGSDIRLVDAESGQGASFSFRLSAA